MGQSKELKKIVVFSLEANNLLASDISLENIEIRKWVPSLRNIIPPNTSFSYILFWMAHYLGVFRNKSYSAYLLFHKNLCISSLVCVPSLFLWPFMNSNDLQYKSVFTHEDFRGKSLAFKLLNYAIKDSHENDRTYWYMTHDRNIASIKLCEKSGFKFSGYYSKSKQRKLFVRVGSLSASADNISV